MASPTAPGRPAHPRRRAGAARMVDVGDKPSPRVRRPPPAACWCPAVVVALLRGEGVPKGDALAVARIAGIMGAKQTPA